jgi:hypothetical protein
MDATLFSLSGGTSLWLVLLALASAFAGIYIFFIGFRMLRFKRMILNTPLSKIHSASIGLVEVSGTPVGPQDELARLGRLTKRRKPAAI